MSSDDSSDYSDVEPTTMHAAAETLERWVAEAEAAEPEGEGKDGGEGVARGVSGGAGGDAPAEPGTLELLGSRADHSLLRMLEEDPDMMRHWPNKRSRQVLSGHFVHVLPTPLPDPELVAFSPAMAAELGLSDAECRTPRSAGQSRASPRLASRPLPSPRLPSHPRRAAPRLAAPR